MRMQAALVVAAGVFIIFASVVCAGLFGEYARLAALMDSGERTQEVLDQASNQQILIVCWFVCCLALVGFGIGLFLRVSRRKYRVRYHTPPSGNPLELAQRVTHRMGPIQFSILTMLALMLAVALACSTCATLNGCQ
jgi:magnesium-transporting ATPase (P-type)